MKQKNFLQTVIDAIPAWVYILDNKANVILANKKSHTVGLKTESHTILDPLGNALSCLNQNGPDKTCGFEIQCHKCTVRNTIKKAFEGKNIAREKCVMTLVTDEGPKKYHLMITCSCFEFENIKHAILTIEDISKIVEIASLVPICSHCKKINHNDKYWEQLETYMKLNHNIEFSHGICPACAKKYYSEYFSEDDF